MSTSGTVKNFCRICGKTFQSSEKAFLVGPVNTDTVQHDNTISINRIGTSKRELLHLSCYDTVLVYQQQKEKRLVELDNRIQKALEIAMQSGGVDGGHHKMWVIDQMVRELTGCPLVKKTAKDYKGVEYEYEKLGESEAYNEWVRNTEDGEDGPNTYEWEVGCPP